MALKHTPSNGKPNEAIIKEIVDTLMSFPPAEVINILLSVVEGVGSIYESRYEKLQEEEQKLRLEMESYLNAITDVTHMTVKHGSL